MELVIAALAITAAFGVAVLAFPRHGIGFEDLLRRSDLDWPRGVQEEEPVRWHVERLRRHSPSSRP